MPKRLVVIDRLVRYTLSSSGKKINTILWITSRVKCSPISVRLRINFLLRYQISTVPDSVEVVRCARCGMFHAGGVFGEACYQAGCKARMCACCGLIHSDYDLTSWILHCIEKFDCELYMPDVDKLEMDGDTIILPDENVQMKLDEIYNMKKLENDKLKQDAKKEQ